MVEINKNRIVKNTIALYFRMFLTMAIGLYTVRIVLQTLGVEDYGIYNVVGGIVAIFSFLSGTMAGASQRFFAVEIGGNNPVRLRQVFSLNVLIYWGIAFLVFFLGETLGLWFFKTQMNIPPERMQAAFWVYQFAIFSFMVSIITIPYYALITIREKMTVYAYISIFESILKLGIVYLLVLFSYDKLKLYAVLFFVVTLIISISYILYCKVKFHESKFTFFWEKKLFKDIINFAGWSLFGALAAVFRNQGTNILLNLFFNPAINAARAISYQVFTAVNQFVQNFFMAVRPQILKSYTSGAKNEMMTLVFQSSKFSYYLIMILSIPILIETHTILLLWLKELPEYVVLFTQLIVINAVIESLANPFMAAVQATGKISKYQAVTGGIILLNLPVSYLFLRLGYPPQITMIISILISIAAQISRIFFMKSLLQMSIKSYIYAVIFPICFVTILAVLPPVIINLVLQPSIMRLCIVTLSSLIFSFLAIYIIGLTKSERTAITQAVYTKVFRRKKAQL